MNKTINRLPAATNAVTLEVRIGKKLRPYFIAWYDKDKKTGESKEQFARRQLRSGAMNSYIQSEGKSIVDELDKAKNDGIAVLNSDVNAFGLEVD